MALISAHPTYLDRWLSRLSFGFHLLPTCLAGLHGFHIVQFSQSSFCNPKPARQILVLLHLYPSLAITPLEVGGALFLWLQYWLLHGWVGLHFAPTRSPDHCLLSWGRSGWLINRWDMVLLSRRKPAEDLVQLLRRVPWAGKDDGYAWHRCLF
jgi:hypothetical protein